MKKLLYALLLLIAVSLTLVFATHANDNDGKMSQNDPFIISSPEELAYFAAHCTDELASANVLLTKDIVWSDYHTSDQSIPASNWTPLGVSNAHFHGTFDGGGHAIYGIVCIGSENVGFFAYAGGTICNLQLLDCFFAGTSAVGGFAGRSCGLVIDGCTLDGKIEAESDIVGGFVGTPQAGTALTITRSINMASVSCATAEDSAACGGFIGKTSADTPTEIALCINFGAVSASTGEAGGLVGTAGAIGIRDSMNAGNVFALYYVGGAIGKVSGQAPVTVEHFLHIGQVRSETDSTAPRYYSRYSFLAGIGQNDQSAMTSVTFTGCYTLEDAATGNGPSFLDTEYFSDAAYSRAALTSSGILDKLGFSDTAWADHCFLVSYLGFPVPRTGAAWCGGVTLLDGASVRLAEGSSGLRFEWQIDRTLYDWLEATYGSALRLGCLITPTDYLTDAEDFTQAALGDGRYVDIVRTQWRSERGDAYTAGAALVNIKKENYARPMSARAYIAIDTEDSETHYFYSDYDAEVHSRSIRYVAEAALADEDAGYTDEQKAILRAYLKEE